MSQAYLVGVLGGVSGTPAGKYRGVVTVLLADSNMFTIESRNEYDTVEGAEVEYRKYGSVAVDRYVEYFKALSSNMRSGQLAAGTHVPICPLIDTKVFVTTARITERHLMAASVPFGQMLLKGLPALDTSENIEVADPKTQEPPKPTDDPTMCDRIKHGDLSTRAYNVIKCINARMRDLKAPINEWSVLASKTTQDLQQYRGLGSVTKSELRDALAKRGLRFADE